jgi:hypothetical protein
MIILAFIIGFFSGYSFQNKLNEYLLKKIVKVVDKNIFWGKKWFRLNLKYRWLRRQLGLKVKMYPNSNNEEIISTIRKVFLKDIKT